MISYHPLCSRITGSNNVLPADLPTKGKIKPNKYLIFELYLQKEKTQVWHVISKKHGDILGVVRWYPRWRQYTFWPELHTIWNPECLMDVCEFIRELMKDRKEGKLR